MKILKIVLIIFPVIYAQNISETSTVNPRCFGVLSRSPLDWIQQALNTTSNAFTLGVETGKQWLNFGINTANQWVNAIKNPSNSTTNNNTSNVNIQELVGLAVQKEIGKLEKDLGRKGTWFRKVKENRLKYLIDKLHNLGDHQNGIKNTTSHISKYSTTKAPVTKPVQSSTTSQDDTVISVVT